MVQILALAVIGLGWYADHIALAAEPTASVKAPSNEVGDVGATLGNVWDMNGLNDIAWTQPDSRNRTVQYSLHPANDPIVPPGASGYVIRGTSPKGSDLATAFYTNASVSIPSQIYRYLIYRSYIAPHQPDEAGIQLTNARLLYSSDWSSNWQETAFPTRRFSKPQRLECPPPKTAYGGWCTFFVDLSQNLYVSGPNPWDWGQPGARVEAFGMWPHENWCNSVCAPSGDTPNFFFLDFVYLTGEIVAKLPDYKYTVKWHVADADGGLLTSTLYYQEQAELRLPSQSPACNASNLATAWKPIPGGTTTISIPSAPYRAFLPFLGSPLSNNTSSFGSGIIGPYNQAFEWNLASSAYVEGKVYYVCVVVQDSNGHKNYQASSAPVIKAPPPTVFNPNNLTFSSE